MISCVYCGGAHERPADVRQCWADRGGDQAVDQPELALDPTPPEPTTASPSVAAGTSPPPRPRRRPPRSSVDRIVVPVARGPVALGRHVIVAPGQPMPADWSNADRVVIDAESLADPSATTAALRTDAFAATARVIEFAVDFETVPESVDDRHPHELGPGHAFPLDELFTWSGRTRSTLVIRRRLAGRSSIAPSNSVPPWSPRARPATSSPPTAPRCGSTPDRYGISTRSPTCR